MTLTTPPTRSTITDDGVTIAYSISGEPGAPPVVLVHGITDSHSDWAPVAKVLATDHRVVALDLRGHGASGEANDYAAMAMSLDVAAVCRAEGIVRPTVVGHSLGAVVASAFAAQYPTAGVVNVDQSLRFSDFAAGLRPLQPMLSGEQFHEALGMIFASMEGTMLTEAQRTDLAEHRRRASQEVVLGVWSMVFDSTDEELDATAGAIGAAIEVPYLSLHGLDPGADYADWLGERIPGATVELWAEHGHYPHLADPERFVRRIRAFMGDHA